jgi:predicted nucleic acid-binding protein
VPERRLVIDANIVIRAIFGTRARALIARYCEKTAFYVAESNFEEALHYLTELGEKRGLSNALIQETLQTLVTMIQLVPDDELSVMREKALERIGKRDPNDWPAVAAALLLDCPIWTEDADFFGSGVATWTSSTVEIYLVGQH